MNNNPEATPIPDDRLIDETDVHDTPTLTGYDYLKWYEDFKGNPEPADAWNEAVERAGKIFNRYHNDIAGLVQENARLRDSLRKGAAISERDALIRQLCDRLEGRTHPQDPWAKPHRDLIERARQIIGDERA
jgi:hypothetical protein